MDSADIKRVKAVSFNVLSPLDIKNMSVVKVQSHKYEKQIDFSLADNRMGCLYKNDICKTCGGNAMTCPGHFGYLELAKPCYNPAFARILPKILRCYCIKCHRFLLDEKERRLFLKKKNRAQRLVAVSQYCQQKKKNCCFEGDSERDVPIGCLSPQPHYFRADKYHDYWSILYSYSSEPKAKEEQSDNPTINSQQRTTRRQVLHIDVAYSMLKDASVEECRVLGLASDGEKFCSKPSSLFFVNFPIPPPHFRPGSFKTKKNMEDNMNKKLSEIVKANNKLAAAIGERSPPHYIDKLWNSLQFQITTYVDNKARMSPATAKRTQYAGNRNIGIIQRISGNGKESRIRGNLCGKRVDFCARTVITPDPNIDLDMVGVPVSIAMALTKEITINNWNIDYYQAMLDKQVIRSDELVTQDTLIFYPQSDSLGFRYPAILKVFPEQEMTKLERDRQFISMSTRLKNGRGFRLEVGQGIRRQLMDGDFVLFNRQPSLHKMSAMGHRVKVMRGISTFRMHPCAAAPYNADFDGDEMSIHVPQSEEATCEVRELMHINKHIVSPQSNRPVIGCVQDTLLGCYQMTQKEVFLEREEVMDLLMRVDCVELPAPAIMYADRDSGCMKQLWTGKQILSCIIPTDLFITKGNAADVMAQDHAEAVEPVIIEDGELLCGQMTKETLGPTHQGLIHVCFMERGPEDTARMIKSLSSMAMAWLEWKGFSVGISDCVLAPEISTVCGEEMDVAKSKIRAKLQNLQKSAVGTEFGIGKMEVEINQILNQVRDRVGQIVLQNKSSANSLRQMVQAGSKGSNLNISQILVCTGQQNVDGQRIPNGFRNRTLPHYHQFDISPESKGFIINSYIKGLTPSEFYFHAMGGREGLVDTAVKTSVTGYLQRKLIKGMEDLVVQYDHTVRNSVNEIVQFSYGEDNRDGAFLEQQEIKIHVQSEATFRDEYYWNPDWDLMFMDLEEWMEAELDLEWNKIQKCRKELLQFGVPKTVRIPVNFKRMITKHSHRCRVTCWKKEYYAEADVITCLQAKGDLLRNMKKYDCLTLNTTALIYSYLASKPLYKVGLCQQHLKGMMEEIIRRSVQTIVQAGESVGCLSAQSIGEPSTQLCLRTFHNAGIGTMDSTLGVPRLKDLIDSNRAISKTSMMLVVKEGYSAQNILKNIVFFKLGDILEILDVCYHPIMEGMPDEDMMTEWIQYPDTENICFQRFNSWFLRLQFSRERVISHDVTMHEVEERINTDFGNQFYICYSDDNSATLVMHIRLRENFPEEIGEIQNEEEEEQETLSEGEEEEENGEEQQQDDTEPLESQCAGELQRAERNLQKFASNYLITPNHCHKKMLSSKRPDLFMRLLKDLIVETPIRGVPGITNARILPDTSDHASCRKIVTSGSNLLGIFGVEGIDHKQTYSNDPVEMLRVFGIEAGKASAIKEKTQVLSFGGSYIDPRHMYQLSETMTYKGSMMSMNRHGINKKETGPMGRASFEESAEQLIRGALFCEKDNLRGITSNIMMGQLGKMGTGIVDVLFDEDKVRQNFFTPISGTTTTHVSEEYDPVYNYAMEGSPPYYQPAPSSPSFYQVAQFDYSTGNNSPTYCPQPVT